MLPRVHSQSPTSDKKLLLDVGSTHSEEISDGYSEDVDGEMSMPLKRGNTAAQGEYNTLDEPVFDTILRDVKAVCVKFRYVLNPRATDSKMLLKEWDLWGPLLLCTFMAVVLQGSGDSTVSANDGGPQFAEVFVIVWVGALVVTLNAKLLGGNMSIFQSVCVIGYCLLAPALALVVCRLLLMMGRSTFLFFLRLVIGLAASVWSTISCMIFVGESQVQERKVLAGYPICLFYAVICWLIISQTD